MDYHGQFRRAALERGIPDDAVRRFAELLRFEIRTSARPEGVAVGRSGGLPRLPVETEWPTVEEDGRALPLPFVASLNCAALPRVDSLPLPPDGSLLFFLEHEHAWDCYDVQAEQRYARVMYVPAGTGTVAVEKPPVGHDEWSLSLAGPFVRPERTLYGSVHPELASWLEYDDEDFEFVSKPARELVAALTHVEELRALVEELWPEDTRGSELWLGGGSMELGMGETPESFIAAASVRARREAEELELSPAEINALEEEETLRVMREWVPLAQFHTYDDVYFGRFMIRIEDLVARRFDRALSFAMFTE
ncbi:hypothetical protein Val02_22470 [Virgisporangium aliadipatigenens]|uniref:DUF1963 domain-containing protein n=1 Tax=Virgisporangium aliadipatigenens TaxID=741659 RepID=A0A8J3YHT5_9ACTN|nr:DUF1963 domain-containing protein [Virgisporangium aliadipatigenens]GIJ45361.1 hypothetical protein Val02_22470 [Virgisporangium aliadipatigenens]